jgi:hypothetical protein
MKYKIVEGASPAALSQTVENYLREGWQLQGGVSHSYTPSYIGYGGLQMPAVNRFAQAMTYEVRIVDGPGDM